MKNRSNYFLQNIALIERIVLTTIQDHFNKNKIKIDDYHEPFLAGGFLLNSILSYLGHNKEYYSDIDIFYFSDEKNQSNDMYIQLGKDEPFYLESYNEQNTNFIKITDCKQPCSSYFFKYFDLNCVRVAFDLKRKKIFFDEHFLYFLDTLEVLILDYQKEYYPRIFQRALSKKNNLGLFFNENISSESETLFTISYNNDLMQKNSFLSLLKKRPETIPYYFFLNTNQKQNLEKLCATIPETILQNSVVRIIQKNKTFFSKNISNTNWLMIDAFFNMEINLPYVDFVQDLLIRATIDISLDQFSKAVTLFFKYQEYLTIFEDCELVDFIYKEYSDIVCFADQKINNYMRDLDQKLYIPINYNKYEMKVKLITSIPEMRKIGFKFKNCIIGQEFSMINSLNTRIFLIEDKDHSSLVRVIKCLNEWTIKDFEAPCKEKPPISHYKIANQLLIDINQGIINE